MVCRVRAQAGPSKSSRGLAAGLALGLALGGAAACTTGAKKEAAKTALDAMSPAERAETFEATARVLDEHPALVDEFYAAARKHRPLLERFYANASKDLAQRPMAEIAAKHLVANPASLEQVFVTNVDFAVEAGPAREAMNRAMASRAEKIADILTDSPPAMSRVLEANLKMLAKKPQADKSALAAVRKNRRQLIELVKSDPELMKEMTEEVLREVVKDKPIVEKALRAAKIIDDDRRLGSRLGEAHAPRGPRGPGRLGWARGTWAEPPEGVGDALCAPSRPPGRLHRRRGEGSSSAKPGRRGRRRGPRSAPLEQSWTGAPSEGTFRPRRRGRWGGRGLFGRFLRRPAARVTGGASPRGRAARYDPSIFSKLRA
ncbi:MAG TPA: hypothetical protein VFS43_31475 [Polyangiaceae bacterium]|nr:hypothetical protein [Polyangiaceae bacterium]